MKKYLMTIALTLSVLTLGYYTHRLFVFAGKVTKAFDYTYSAIDCLIQVNGQNESDVDILFSGFRSREAYNKAIAKSYPGLFGKNGSKREAYNNQIPECHDFYARHRCWLLDPKDPKSLDGCGKHFGLMQDEIDLMKKDPSTVDKTMEIFWKRAEKTK